MFPKMGYTMKWRVVAARRTLKVLERMPLKARDSFWRLFAVLGDSGPTGPRNWRNYGKLKSRDAAYHCHLTADHRWVACWRAEEDTLVIEIFYLGSHQDAPY
jgi:hypothetical protein